MRVAITSSSGEYRAVHLLDSEGNFLWGSWIGPVALDVWSVAFDHAGRLGVAGSFRETDFLGVHYVPQGEADAFYLQFEP